MPGSTEASPRLRAPAGMCDTHIHFYDHKYPLAPTATMDPPDASVADYLKLRKRLGIERTVVVQATAYGTDNRCTLDAVSQMGDSARGVVVVDDSVSDAELERLTKAGVRGLRFHMLAGGVLPWDLLERMSARVREFGWLIQLQCDGRQFPEREAMIRRASGTVIIDHIGKFLEPVPVDHPSFLVLLRLLEKSNIHLRLAGAYEVSKVGAPSYGDVGALAKAAIRAAPEKIVWASNWPHVGAKPNNKPDDAGMLDLLLDWAPDEMVRKKILVDTPARLYGFA
jgi:D-galactarolactone isomerase